MSTTTLLRLPDLQGQPFDVYFRYDEFGADSHSPPHLSLIHISEPTRPY